MTASTTGILLTKSDRINSRIDEFEKYFLKQVTAKENENISKEDFLDFVKSIHLIVTTELNQKGVERKWKE